MIDELINYKGQKYVHQHLKLLVNAFLFSGNVAVFRMMCGLFAFLLGYC